MIKRTPLAAALLAGLTLPSLVSGCGGSTRVTPSTAAPAGSAPPAAAHGTCPDIKPSTPGVLTPYCTGTATVKVSVGAVNRELRGGTCTASAGLFVVNAGVPTTHEYPGPRPDFVAVNAPPQGGSGQDTGATVILDGKFYGDTGRFGGTAAIGDGGRTVHFTGRATNGDQATIDVTC